MRLFIFSEIVASPAGTICHQSSSQGQILIIDPQSNYRPSAIVPRIACGPSRIKRSDRGPVDQTFRMGSLRTRVPVAAKIAFPIAGATVW
jgi:hypothetical protein